jgi:hypothetical protein
MEEQYFIGETRMLSTRQMLKVVVLAAIVAAFVAPSALAVEKAAPAEVTLKGTVTAVADVNGVVTAVKLTVGEVTYQVVLDDNGKKLAELNGKEAEVTGVLSGNLIKVSSFKAVAKE